MSISIYRRPTLALLALTLVTTNALADGHRLPAIDQPSWRNECGACHTAFHPGLLPAASWEKIMSGLDRHFGSDASLSAKDQASIRQFLVSNAASRGKFARDSGTRISEAGWFVHEHGRVLSRSGVKSAAQCSACHPDADRGDFNEHAIRLPRKVQP